MKIRGILPTIVLALLPSCKWISPAEVTQAEIQSARVFWKAQDIKQGFEEGLIACKTGAYKTPNPNQVEEVCINALIRFMDVLRQGEK